MSTGRVRFFHTRKSFGFIGRDGGPDVFFHSSDFHGGVPEEGTEVRFTIKYGARGPRAVDIEPTP